MNKDLKKLWRAFVLSFLLFVVLFGAVLVLAAFIFVALFLMINYPMLSVFCAMLVIFLTVFANFFYSDD